MNRLQLIGRLGRDPEVKTSARGVVVTFSVATNEYAKDRLTGETTVSTEWHDLVLFEPLATVARDQLRKGVEIFAEGRIHSHKWTDGEGKPRVDKDVRVDTLRILRLPRGQPAVAQLDAIEELARARHAGTRADATFEDLANMIASVRENLTEGK